MSKRVLLSGYYGFGNTGDEAIVEALCQELRRQDPQVAISVLLDNQELAQRLLVTAYRRKSPRAIWQALRSSSVLISGGGGLIQDSTGLGSVVYYLGIIALARLAGRESMIMCQGFGPLKSGVGRLLARLLLPCVKQATWRDAVSLAEVKDLAPKLPSKLTADPALLLEPEPAERCRAIRYKNNLDFPYIVIALRRWEGLDLEAFVAVLQSFLERNHEVSVALIPFQESQDMEITSELVRRLGAYYSQRVRTLTGLLPTEIIGIIDTASMVVAMRLHALIFAASRQVPCLGMVYDPKVERFCERCGAPHLSLKASREELEALWFSTWNEREAVSRRIGTMVEPMRALAREAVSQALELCR